MDSSIAYLRIVKNPDINIDDMSDSGQKIRLLAGTVILYLLTAAWLNNSIKKQIMPSHHHKFISDITNYQIGMDPTPAPPIPLPNDLNN